MWETSKSTIGENMSKLQDDLLTIGGLSNPSKMPCESFSLPPKHCRVGSKLRDVPGSTCADCYACKGCYLFKSTQTAMDRRYRILTEALEAFEGGDSEPLALWVSSFAAVLNDRLARRGQAYFRWHDAGDLQSRTHYRALCAIAEQAPGVRFWLPTRESALVAQSVAAGDRIPANLVTRISAHYVDREARLPRGLEGFPTSEVHTGSAPTTGALACPAYQNDGECGECRACWDSSVRAVSYPLH